MKNNDALDALLPCPFCGGQPTKGLTKKTGCQMHGDPIQYAIIGCLSCEPKPSFRGGCVYRGGDKPKFKKEAYEEAAIKWNNRANTRPQPSGDAVKALDEAIKSQPCNEKLCDWFEKYKGEIRATLSTPKPDLYALIAEVMEGMKAAGDSYYCKAIDLADKNCRGSQYKLENGKFTEDDLKWHSQHHELIGKHRGLYEALEKLTAALTQPKADVEGLKSEAWHELQKQAPNCNVAWAVNFIIDHLATQGYIGVPKWQPIETAPKDGTWIMVYWPTMGIGQYPFVVFWDEGWQPARYSDRDYGEAFPTHWMPLPAAPKKEGM